MSAQGVVKARKLNIRSGAGTNFSIVTTVNEGAVLEVVEQLGEWTKIRTLGAEGYVSTQYLDIQPGSTPPPAETPQPTQQGEVITKVLNVRSGPGTNFGIISTVNEGAVLDVLGQSGEWTQIQVGAGQGYVSSQYVRIKSETEAPPPAPVQMRGTVITKSLNVRSGPGTNFGVIAAVGESTVLDILQNQGDWLKVRVASGEGYVSSQFVEINTGQSLTGYLIERPELMEIELVPEKIIPTSGLERADLAVANTWNGYGNLMSELGGLLKVPINALIGVLVAESGGRVFGSDGRMIIRFENHLFYRFWGEANKGIFNQFFRFDTSSGANNWKQHQWRRNPDQPWENFHGNQSHEWEILAFARSLDDTAALMSISMGAPQIMGFNYKRLGYESVQFMFDNFARSAHAQLLAMFDFVKGPSSSSAAIQALRTRDYLTFASIYNGPANAETYREIIQVRSNIFDQLIKRAVVTPRENTESRGPVVKPNQAPVAKDDSFSTGQDTPVTISITQLLANDSDADNDQLSISGVEVIDTAQGRIVDNQDGTFTFTPAKGFIGTASGRYTVSDGRGGSGTANIVFEVKAVIKEEPLPQPDPEPVVDVTPAQPPSNQEAVFVSTVEGLNVRSEPVVKDGNIIDVLALNEPMAVLETLEEATAKMKLGKSGNKFIKVRTDKAREGYVAAWLVSPSSNLVTDTTNAYIDSIPDQYPIPPEYYAMWEMADHLGLPDPFNVLPVQIRTQHKLVNMQVNCFGPNTFASRNWRNFYSRVGGMHNGSDFIVETGTPLLAVADGVIIRRWPFMGNSADKTVILWPFLPERYRDAQGKRMMSNVLVAYAHMSNNTIKKELDVVKAGDVIGISGTPAGTSSNDHLHLEVHLLTGDTKLLNPRKLAARRLLTHYKHAQPFSNQVPWNTLLFYTPRLINYQLHQGKTVGFMGRPSYPTAAQLKAMGAGHLPELHEFSLGYYEYGISVVWENKGKPWPNGVVTMEMLPERLRSFDKFEPYPATFL